ncbi:16S rRNA (guanine(527)-N(7))-methyltransferase RsmG [Serpentinicella sp. ANB-PHB4]|uniref:16S rRNA (guanine(527)-N(7))-methyltransferase RsmG n=1 Tax=Serpentinicella sp. ANB-PHB4 TaxID=3074076 RepID=UPI00285FCC51|nr:16S rRNA (guanine(527)-N(7))-methyltransferase RsmG [Serpentinicella sp. ANB-PHB4]MDR5658904.1 16S rRNA (guanine(527)-N(7))-methyltransferase RsmG [Serpentinicella sp. ANB-PHB4]
MMLEEVIEKGSLALGYELNEEQTKQFIIYKDLLLEWNQKMNLTAIEDEHEIGVKHFLDSISCIKSEILKPKGKIIDVGTGAGFPGIPIKILFPDIDLTLLDSLNKRINFLKEVGNQTGLDNVEYIHGRAEEYGTNKNYREQFDYAVARAVAPLNILAEYCLPFVKVGGYFICQKGKQLDQELNAGEKAVKILGGKIEKQIDIPLPFSDIVHNLLVIKKINNTSTKFPRKAGKPSKDPIK